MNAPRWTALPIAMRRSPLKKGTIFSRHGRGVNSSGKNSSGKTTAAYLKLYQ